MATPMSSEQKGGLQAYSFTVSVVPLVSTLPLSFSSPTLRSSLSSSSLASSSSLDIIPTPIATSPSIGDSPASSRPDVLLIEATHIATRRIYATQVRREQLPALAGSLQDCRLRLISALEQKARFLTATISQPLLQSASGLELRVVVRDPEEITPDQVLQFYLTPRTPLPATPSETGSPSSVACRVDDELVHRLEQQVAEQAHTLRQVIARAQDEATFAGEQRRLMSEQLKSLTERVDKAERLHTERERHHAQQVALLTQQLAAMHARLENVQQQQSELQQLQLQTRIQSPKSPSAPDAAPVPVMSPATALPAEQLTAINARLADLTDAHRAASDRFATFTSEVDAREFPLRLNPGWSNFDNHSYPLATFRRQHNRVFLSGMVAGGSGVIAQLPPGYRPTHRILLNAQGDVSGGDGRIVRLDIHADGQIWHSRGPAGWITLTGINFSTVGPAVAPAVLRTSMVMNTPAPAPASSSSMMTSSVAVAH